MPRAPRVSTEEWQNHRERIQELRSRMQLKELILHMQHNYQFYATAAQYKKQFAQWGLSKVNTKRPEFLWTTVEDRIKKRRRENKDSRVTIDNVIVPTKKVRKEISRHALSVVERAFNSATDELPQNVLVNTPSPINNAQILPFHFPRPVSYRTLPWIFFDSITFPVVQSHWPLQPRSPGATPYSPRHMSDVFDSIIPSTLTIADLDISSYGLESLEKQNIWGSHNLPTLNTPSPDFSTNIPSASLPNEDPQQWLGRFTKSDDLYHSVVPLFRHVVYLASNNLVDHDKLRVILEWTIENRLLWVIVRLGLEDSPTFTAFISQLLCNAIEIGDLSVVKTLLSLGAGASSYLPCSCTFNRSPLEKAFSQIEVRLGDGSQLECDKNENRVSIVEALISSGADVNAVTSETPLQKAVLRRSTRITRCLLQAGAHADAPATNFYDSMITCSINDLPRCLDIRTPIQIAYSSGDLEIFWLLLDYGANINACVSPLIFHVPNFCLPVFEGTFLALAVDKGDISFARVLLAAGAHPASPEITISHKSPLLRAVERGDAELTRLLLVHLSTIVHAVGSQGSSPELYQYYEAPLLLAVQQNNAELTELLLNACAVFALDQPKKGFLFERAICSNSLSTLKLLGATFGWDIPQATINSAIQTFPGGPGRAEDALKSVLKIADNANRADEFGRTPLLAACHVGNTDLVRFLLNLGADPTVPNRKYPYHQSPLSESIKANKISEEVVEVLIDAGAPLNDEALHAAIRVGSARLVNKILSAGAFPNSLYKPERYLKIVDSESYDSPRTSIQLASYHGHEGVVKTLLQAGADPNVGTSCGCTPLGFVLAKLTLEDTASGDDLDNRLLPKKPTHLRLLKNLLKYGAHANQPFHLHDRQLDQSFKAHNPYFRLLEEQRYVEAQNLTITPLAYIAAFRKVEAIEALRLLLEAGAESHVEQSMSSLSGLQISAVYGSTETMELLLLKGDRESSCSLIDEVYRGDENFPSAVEAAFLTLSNEKLDALKKVCGSLILLGESHWPTLALRKAAMYKNVMFIRQLLECGVDPNRELPAIAGSSILRDYLGFPSYLQYMTPLQLLSEPNIEDQGATSAETNLQDKVLEIAEALLEAGADINLAVDGHGTPLAIAVERGYDELGKLYLSQDASVNPPLQSLPYWLTPLQAAAKVSNIDLVQRMLDEGADVNAHPAPVEGGTALQFAAMNGHIHIAMLLLKHGADVNASGSEERGRTALGGAAEHGRLDMVYLLLENSELDDRESIKGQCITAAESAEREGHSVVAKVLRQWEADN